MALTLVVLAAGLSSRYGRPKGLEPVGPAGEALFDYGVYDAIRAGFAWVVLVTRRELEAATREHVDRIFGPAIPVSFVVQQLDDLPPGFTAPTQRRTPWGTGHAVLSVRSVVDGPFVVMNADDFYGAAAFQQLAGHFQDSADSAGPDYAAVGYRLGDTLSAVGGVSRAVCELDECGYLRRVVEIKNLRLEDDALTGVTLSGEVIELTGEETISMNLFAATPRIFPSLEQCFARFLEARGADLNAEFLLSMAANDLLIAGEARVKVIPTPGPWLGITHPEDREHVRRGIRELIAVGHYPDDLSAVDYRRFRPKQPLVP